jgi:hypothetical protein
LNYLTTLKLILLLGLTLPGCTVLAPDTRPAIAPTTTQVTASSTYDLQTQPVMATLPAHQPDLASPTPPSVTATPSVTPFLENLPALQGNLNNQISRLEENAPRAESQDFYQPEPVALADFRNLIEELLAGRLQVAAEIANLYDYQLIRYTDHSGQYTEVYLLRESRPFRRGWGLYVFRLEACRQDVAPILVEAPHVLADEDTPQIALDTFRVLHACALLVGGAHRNANQDGSADVAHNPRTVFQAIHEALLSYGGQTSIVLQIHGFAADRHPGYPAVVLGGSPPGDPNLAMLLADLSQALVDQGITAGLCDGANWTALCGETNAQAADLTTGLFIHLELDESVRFEPTALINGLVDGLEIYTEASPR